MDKEIRYFVNGWSFRLSFATRPGYDGDHEDISDGDSYELAFMYSSPYRSNTYSTRLPLPITSPAQTCHGRRGLLPAPILTAPSKSRP